MGFKITLACSGVDAGAIAAKDIEAEFRDHRRWHRDVYRLAVAVFTH
jgi:hypothetical protein